MRGPQGTRQGGNAIAGLILVRSNEPSENFTGQVRLGLGEYGEQLAEFGVGGPLGKRLRYRIAGFAERSDGYYYNRHLQRDDVNGLDERGVRLKLHLDASERVQLRASLMRTDADNGYDAFTLDNSRTTWSDQPGPDELAADVQTLEADYTGEAVRVLLVGSRSSADVNYGYDEDWTYPGFAEDFADDNPADDYDPYQNTDTYLRDYQQQTWELRVQSADAGGSTRWLLGLYRRDNTTDLRRVNGYFTSDYLSQTREDTEAVFAEVQSQLREHLDLIVGYRHSRRDSRFSDSGALRRNTSDSMSGGRLLLDWQLREGLHLYGQYARGFKAGGINYDHVYLTPQERPYDTEFLNSYEFGLRLNSGALRLRAALFYMRRDNPQLNTSQVYNNQNDTPDDDTDDFFDYIDFFTNARSGTNLGGELELHWSVRPQLSLDMALGLLDTEYGGSLTFTDDLDTYEVGGREQAHAPRLSARLGADWSFGTSWRWSAHLQHRDSFYSNDSSDARLKASTLLHTRLAWEQPRYTVALWMRNVTDADLHTHALYFGNDPRDGYAANVYYQYGEPRHGGVEWRVRLGEGVER